MMEASATYPTAEASIPTVDLTDVAEEEPEEEEEEELRFLGSIKCQIVGIRYYRGEAHPGEYVKLVREPNNPYDRNAIRVENLSGEKVGHIKKEQAAALTPIMDGSLDVKLDGTIPYAGNQWNLPLMLEFYGKEASLAVEVGRMLKRHRIGLQQSPLFNASTNTTAANNKPSVVVQKKKLDWRTQQKQLDDLFDQQSKSQLSNLPRVSVPALQVELFPHQVDGIRWMCHRETGNIEPPFFRQVKEQNKTMWLSEITQSSQSTPPTPVVGGILADEMGIGKTLQTLGLILANPPEDRDYNVPKSEKPPARKMPSKTALSKLKPPALTRVLEDARVSPMPSTTKTAMVNACMDGLKQGTISIEQYYRSTEAPKTTLIVCPVSVMSNWTTQINDHVRENTLRVEIYHGPARHDLLSNLNDIDVLIASYNTISYDFADLDKANKRNGKEPAMKKSKKSSPLFEARFHRIILDEAHSIRSSKTRTYRAITSVQADRKFCLTGTPLTNRPDDIQSLFAFLGVEPLGDKDVFRRAVSQPIQAGDEVGLARLRAMMSHITLRRNKSTANITLPDKTVELRSVDFPDNSPHAKIHQTLFKTAQVAFQATLRGGDSEALKNYVSVLETLLRIRQACCSGVLVPKDRLERAENVLSELEGLDGMALSAEEGKELLEKLKGTFEEENVECAVCLCEMEESVAVILRSCSHVYCQTCISRVASEAHSNCPLCRVPFCTKDMIEKNAASRAVESSSESAVSFSQSMEELGQSPKIAALLEAIGEMKPGEKGVIYSQFTKFLDEITKHLDANKLTHTRIDGKKTSTQRMEAMKLFASESDDSPQLILCSLHAAGTGINLTSANHVFMCDTWWNASAEQQAMDRVHRIGQKLSVRVLRFVMKGTIEERMVALQQMKEAIAKGSMEKLKPDETRKARVADLKSLFDLGTESSDSKA